MYLFMIVTLVGSLLIGILQLSGGFATEPVREAKNAAVELSKYRNFTESVDAYMAANPTYSGTLTWSTLIASPTTPISYRQATMPSSYKAVVAAGSWVVCGELSQVALAKLVKDLPRTHQGALVPATGKQFHVVGPSSLNFSTEAAKCM